MSSLEILCGKGIVYRSDPKGETSRNQLSISEDEKGAVASNLTYDSSEKPNES